MLMEKLLISGIGQRIHHVGIWLVNQLDVPFTELMSEEITYNSHRRQICFEDHIG